MVYDNSEEFRMTYSVKQLSDLAGISKRTLHYYDEIGLLKPASIGANGYRYYTDDAILKLQQILFFRELDFSLEEIKGMVNKPEFDRLRALQLHRVELQRRVARLNRLIDTIEHTISFMEGKSKMKKKEVFQGFNDEKQQRYTDEAKKRYGGEVVQESVDRWNSYSAEKKAAIQAEQESIFTAICNHMVEGYDSPEVQKYIQSLHRNMEYFYECSLERFNGLGHLYNESPDFIEMYQVKYHPDMPGFLEKAIGYYCEQRGHLS